MKPRLIQLESEGKQKGDRFRANQAEAAEPRPSKLQITNYKLPGSALRKTNASVTPAKCQLLTERMETLQRFAKEWETTGRKRLKEVEKILQGGKYAVDEQKQLAKLDKQLEKLGYDVSAHDAARDKELELRAVEEEYANLKSAREVSKQIEGEIANLKAEIKNRESEMGTLEAEYQTAQANLEAAQAGAPNLDEAERELFRLREEENKTRAALGGAQQRVDILETLRSRKAGYEKKCEELQKQIGRHRTLERAFGKDGVPALLIEQALPQIEDKANELLDRLSDGQMSIRFATQTEYKDKRRDDLRETLDIQISDGAGIRNYEMYSGGEAFRVNFAIRLRIVQDPRATQRCAPANPGHRRRLRLTRYPGTPALDRSDQHGEGMISPRSLSSPISTSSRMPSPRASKCKRRKTALRFMSYKLPR